MSKKESDVKKINPNKLKTRDYHLLKIIAGATKANVQTDRKKEANKKLARQKIRREDEE